MHHPNALPSPCIHAAACSLEGKACHVSCTSVTLEGLLRHVDVMYRVYVDPAHITGGCRSDSTVHTRACAHIPGVSCSCRSLRMAFRSASCFFKSSYAFSYAFSFSGGAWSQVSRALSSLVVSCAISASSLSKRCCTAAMAALSLPAICRHAAARKVCAHVHGGDVTRPVHSILQQHLANSSMQPANTKKRVQCRQACRFDVNTAVPR